MNSFPAVETACRCDRPRQWTPCAAARSRGSFDAKKHRPRCPGRVPRPRPGVRRVLEQRRCAPVGSAPAEGSRRSAAVQHQPARLRFEPEALKKPHAAIEPAVPEKFRCRGAAQARNRPMGPGSTRIRGSHTSSVDPDSASGRAGGKAEQARRSTPALQLHRSPSGQGRGGRVGFRH